MKHRNIIDKKIIAEKLKLFYKRSKLAARIPSRNTNFESYLPNIATSILVKPLEEKYFKDSFFALKSNKSPGHHKLQVNAIRNL